MSYIEGLDELFQFLDGVPEGVVDAIAEGMAHGMMRTVMEAKNNAPTGDTSQLKNSITSHADVNGDTVEGTILAGAEYAAYVEMGTGPRGNASHAGISPDANPTYKTEGWTYKDPKRGFIYTLGQPARPFLYPAYKRTKDKIKADMEAAVAKKLGGG